MRTSFEDNRQTFPMEGTPDAGSGGFEILCITAGEGNGWYFSAEVLRDAVPLFNGLQCFIDHLPLDSGDGHSIRDVGGLITDPVFDEAVSGIRAKLTPFGPSAELLRETCNEVLAMDSVETRIGFSADLGFNCDGNTVTEIVKVYSVDLVVDPARGGAVLRALNHIREKQAAEKMRMQMKNDQNALIALKGEQEKMNALQEEARKARALRVEMCRHVLDSALAGCGLPTVLRDRVRENFSNRVFEPGN